MALSPTDADKDGNVKVRNIFRPFEEVTVPYHEAVTLERKKLLYTGSATTDSGAASAVEKQQKAVAGQKSES